SRPVVRDRNRDHISADQDGRNRNGRFGVSNRDKQTCVHRDCRRQPSTHTALQRADLKAVARSSFAHRIVSRPGRISAIAMSPPTNMTTPQIVKPVLKPSSGVVAASTTLPMT